MKVLGRITYTHFHCKKCNNRGNNLLKSLTEPICSFCDSSDIIRTDRKGVIGSDGRSIFDLDCKIIFPSIKSFILSCETYPSKINFNNKV